MQHGLRFTVICEKLPEEVSELVMSALLNKLEKMYEDKYDVDPDSINIRAYAVEQLGGTHAQVIHIEASFYADLGHIIDINSAVFNVLSARHLLSYRGLLFMHKVNNVIKGSD